MTELSGFGFGVGVGDVSVLVNIEESIISEHIEIVKAATPAPLLSMTKQNLDMLKSFTPTIADWQKNSLGSNAPKHGAWLRKVLRRTLRSPMQCRE